MDREEEVTLLTEVAGEVEIVLVTALVVVLDG